MTSGTITLDNMVDIGTTSCGSNTKAGTYFYRTWSGGDNPGLHKIPQSYSMDLVTYEDRPFRYLDNANPSNPRIITGTVHSCFGVQAVIDNWNSNYQLALIAKLRKKVVGSDFNLGIFLGEGHQTLNMIGDTAKTLYHSYKAFRQGRFSTALSIALGQNEAFQKAHKIKHIKTRDYPSLLAKYQLKGSMYRSFRRDLASKHLEMVYGWLPLMEDAKDGAEALAHRLNVPQVFRVHVHDFAAGSFPNASPNRFLYGPCRTDVNIIAYLKEEGNIPTLHSLSDPLPVLWELTPWSFVVDWFFPIGTWLEARGVSNGLKGTFVTSTKFMYDIRLGLKGIFQEIDPIPYTYKRVKFRRVVSSNIDIPLPTIVPFKEAYSWKRALNAVALVLQRS